VMCVVPPVLGCPGYAQLYREYLEVCCKSLEAVKNVSSFQSSGAERAFGCNSCAGFVGCLGEFSAWGVGAGTAAGVGVATIGTCAGALCSGDTVGKDDGDGGSRGAGGEFCAKGLVDSKVVDVSTSVGCNQAPVGDVKGLYCNERSGGNGVSSSGRGPNFARNKANREAQKLRKEKRKMMGQDWRVNARQVKSPTSFVESVDRSGSRKVDSVVDVDSNGFWKSCAPELRQELINSKAAMHVAENRRREREANARIAEMDSPMGILNEVMKGIRMAEEAAKRSNDQKVAGWAQTVASSYAEHVASTASSGIKSFESFVESSASSVPIDVHEGLWAKYYEEQAKAETLRKEVEDLRKKTSVQDLTVQVQKNDLDGCSGLRRDLMNEERKLVAKYETMLGYDPVVLQMEKAMLKNKAKYAPLFKVNKS